MKNILCKTIKRIGKRVADIKGVLTAIAALVQPSRLRQCEGKIREPLWLLDFVRVVGRIIVSFSTALAITTAQLNLTAFATTGSIGSSKLATGTEQLIKDVTSWLLIVAPLVTVVAVIYYFIRKAVADEMDHKKWNTRITTAIICCIGVVAASLIINLIVGYYK
jgi:hypothetical protein